MRLSFLSVQESFGGIILITSWLQSLDLGWGGIPEEEYRQIETPNFGGACEENTEKIKNSFQKPKLSSSTNNSKNNSNNDNDSS